MTFRFTTAGESHGRGLVGILEGIPAGLPVSAERINAELKRRMGGYGRGARMKIESDQIEWLAGVRAGETLGSPIAMLVWNRDWRSEEHTSELQSRVDLVCRLLLEKKKKRCARDTRPSGISGMPPSSHTERGSRNSSLSAGTTEKNGASES